MAPESVALPARFRFAGRGSTTGTNELAALLQSRLRGIAVVIKVTMLVLCLLLTARMRDTSASGERWCAATSFRTLGMGGTLGSAVRILAGINASAWRHHPDFN